MKKVIYIAVLFVVLLCTTNAFAQSDGNANQQSNMEVSAVVKMSGISPAVGAEFAFDQQNKLRTLGFFSVNSTAARDSYLLDLSYLHMTDWLNADAPTIYWGINMNLQFDDTVIGPGALIGASYQLGEQIAVFGEAGLNIYSYNDGNDITVGMLNSGIGLQVRL